VIFMAGGNAYSLVHEHKNGWNPEAFRERYSEILERFDFIVGDWGYSQLRLRGFYRDGHPRASKDSVISSLVDYINEYCNFGCAYFVVTKSDSKDVPPERLNLPAASSETAAALNEAGEQVAETAAASNGPIMRWPLKERPGGPARVPNITVSAVARAAENAEKRNAGGSAANAASGGSTAPYKGGGASNPRHGQDGTNRQGRSNSGSGGGDRKQGQGSQSFGKPQHNAPRGQRQQQAADEGNRSGADLRQVSDFGGGHGDASRNGSRWPGKNRRRKSFGGKPGHKPEGSSRTDAANPRMGE